MNHIRFKTKRSFLRAFMMHPLCIMILGDMAYWALVRRIPFIVTETVTTKEEDDAINRGHSVHRRSGGFDVRIDGWSEKDLSDFEFYFENKYRKFAAVSQDSGLGNLVVIHEGTKRHIHVQISLTYGLYGFNLKEQLYEIDS